MYHLLVLLPLLGAVAAWIVPSNRHRPLVVPATALLHGIVVAAAFIFPPGPSHGGWVALDAIGGIVLVSSGLLFTLCSVYAVGYLQLRQERSNRVLCFCLLVCLAAMSAAAISQHLGILWIAVETTTLTMAPLIYFNRNARSVEATWKYMLICSVGIALALLGLFFLAYSTIVARTETTLLLPHLAAKAATLSPVWLNAAIVFLLVGFGTKAGLAPLHTWKPDAYGEAPGLVGALLSGGLVNCAILGILRVYQVAAPSPSADFLRNALVLLGLLSVAVAAVFLLQQSDFKRMLAYSSVEQVGIVAVALGIGGNALFAALFHMLNNSLAKGALFLASGNIHRSYETKNARQVRGALRRLPITAGLFTAGFFAITGSPPFGNFASSFRIIATSFEGGRGGIATTVLLLMGIVFIGMSTTILPMIFGNPPPSAEEGYRDSWIMTMPPLVLLAIVLALGFAMPSPLEEMLRDGAALLGGQR